MFSVLFLFRVRGKKGHLDKQSLIFQLTQVPIISFDTESLGLLVLVILLS